MFSILSGTNWDMKALQQLWVQQEQQDILFSPIPSHLGKRQGRKYYRKLERTWEANSD